MSSGLARAAAVLLFVDLAIVALFAGQIPFGVSYRLFDLDHEGNLGAWWSGGKYMIAGALLAIVLLTAPERTATHPVLYIAVSIGLIILSADEILALHERVTPVNRSLEFGLPTIRNQGAWISLYAILCLAFVIFFFRFIVQLVRADPRSSALVCCGLAIVVSGAVGVEVLGCFRVIGSSPTLQILLEETLELVGASGVLLGVARHANWIFGPVGSSAQAPAPRSASHSRAALDADLARRGSRF